MTDEQWDKLTKTTQGKTANPLPVGFIIDSPWLPNWCGIRILDYFTSDEHWFRANVQALNEFPDVLFLPGFWSEFGMCTEPSAFGVRCVFPADEFPHAHKILGSPDDIESLPQPNPRTDGLLPFVLNRLKLMQPRIEAAGHRIRFAVARGPLNIASYLLGTTEFLTLMMTDPERAEALVKKVTAFLKDWLSLQRETFPSIDGVLLLDDIIGFIGEKEFRTFALPYFRELFDADVGIRFLHNDAPCRVSAPFLPEMGVNLFNMGFEIPLNELKRLTQNKVALLGNIPPRDVLAAGNVQDVANAATGLLESLEERSRVIVSCGGGMPPGVKSENISAFVRAVRGFESAGPPRTGGPIIQRT
jgi:uroporphyrinogen-III decarboxylase